MGVLSLALVPLLAVAAGRPDAGVVTAGGPQAGGGAPRGGGGGGAGPGAGGRQRRPGGGGGGGGGGGAARLGKFDRRCRRQGVVPGVYVLDGWCRPWTAGAGPG